MEEEVPKSAPKAEDRAATGVRETLLGVGPLEAAELLGVVCSELTELLGTSCEEGVRGATRGCVLEELLGVSRGDLEVWAAGGVVVFWVVLFPQPSSVLRVILRG